MFENAELGIPCPGCGQKNPKAIAWIKANNHGHFVCDGCGERVRVEADELIAGLDKVDKSIADLRKAIGGGKKTIKIKF